jgi:hypothetical protein
MRSILRRLSRRHSTAVAYLALFAALGGSAYAAVTVTGKNIKDGTITGKDVRNRSLGTKKLSAKAISSLTGQRGPAGPQGQAGPQGPAGPSGVPGSAGGDLTGTYPELRISAGAVNSAKIADGTVGAPDIAPMEPFHRIGGPGEPQFFNGGEGDCVWRSGGEGIPGTAPAGFAMDALGRVWMQGVATATAGPGGDGVCDPSKPGEAEDGVVFALPPAYRPGFFDASGAGHKILIASNAGAEFSGATIPPGGVWSEIPAGALLEGVSIRAAAGAQRSAATRAELSTQALNRLTG